MLNEAIEQQGELLWTFRELRNLVLPEYLNARHYVLWEEVEHGAGLVFHERRVRNSPLDRITALRWSMRPDQQRYLRTFAIRAGLPLRVPCEGTKISLLVRSHRPSE